MRNNDGGGGRQAPSVVAAMRPSSALGPMDGMDGMDGQHASTKTARFSSGSLIHTDLR